MMERLIRWLGFSRLLTLLLTPLRRSLAAYFKKGIESNGGIVIHGGKSYTDSVIELSRRIKSETELLINNYEACWLVALAKGTAKIGGDLAEVGVYKGGSAKLICEVKGNRLLHLFDTFNGLPTPNLSVDIDRRMWAGNYRAPVGCVIEYLRAYPNVYIYKGFFPVSSSPVKDKTFSFVHLDADLYESTLNSLVFFYPRMNQGGAIVSHNYTNLAGVKKAFNEFFQDKPEIVIELLGSSQCLVVKL